MSELKPLEERGMFVVLYAPNNLGKSVQIRRLVGRLNEQDEQVMRVKYPIYDLEPTGPRINQALRHGDMVPEDVLQMDFAQNRHDFQPTLIEVLNAGVNVVAEDYTGTGIAWGASRDVPLEELLAFNEGLIEPDAAVLLDGERFTCAKEKGHRNEDGETGIWERNREIHKQLAEQFGWEVVNANGTIEDVHEEVWNRVEHLFIEP